MIVIILESQTFKEPSAQWLTIKPNNNKKMILNQGNLEIRHLYYQVLANQRMKLNGDRGPEYSPIFVYHKGCFKINS